MTNEKIKQDIESGRKEGDVYTEEGREELVEEDAISDQEEGFVKGYEAEEKIAFCNECGKVLVDEKFIEMEIEDETLRFCSEECAEEYTKSTKKKKEE